jgi:hypothetical protein
MEIGTGVIEVIRLLHDSTEVRLHLPQNYQNMDPPPDID